MKALDSARTREFIRALLRVCRDHGIAVDHAYGDFVLVPYERSADGYALKNSEVAEDLSLDKWSTTVPRPPSPTLDAVAAEMLRARAKFPRNRKMLAALMEEVGEVARALLQRKGREDVQKECIQVAATALRIFEEGDADFGDEEFEKKGWGAES